MTDTNTLAPTDAELRVLWRQHAPEIGGTLSFARAVLVKFGAPAPAASEALITVESSLRFRLACAKDDVEQLEIENRKLRECVAGLKAGPASQPVAVPAGIEPAGIVTVTSHKTFLDLSISEWRDECPDGEYPVFTAAQVLAMLDAAPRNAPLYDPDDVAFSAWCCAMDDGITAAQKGGQHAER